MPDSPRGLRFAVRTIKEREGLAYSGPVPVEDFDGKKLFGEATLPGGCTVDLEFSVGGSRILMEGRVQGEWLLPCNRCLKAHRVPLSGDLEETYPATAETIDVGEDVRQALVLSLPQRSLCHAACKGLCARCGANLNDEPCGCPEGLSSGGKPPPR